MSKIKSIMIIHIAKTRAQVKSIALISIGPNVRMKKKGKKKERKKKDGLMSPMRQFCHLVQGQQLHCDCFQE